MSLRLRWAEQPSANSLRLIWALICKGFRRCRWCESIFSRGELPPRRNSSLKQFNSALVEAFDIPDDDRTQRLVEHERDNLEIDSGRSEKYTLVEITAFPGRSPSAKRALSQAMVRNLVEAGVPADDILIVLLEPPMANWGIPGGKSADEVDLGFSVDV